MSAVTSVTCRPSAPAALSSDLAWTMSWCRCGRLWSYSGAQIPNTSLPSVPKPHVAERPRVHPHGERVPAAAGRDQDVLALALHLGDHVLAEQVDHVDL